MTTTGIAIINPSDMKDIIKEALREHDQENKKKDEILFYSAHRAAKILKRSDRTILRLIRDGIIKATQDNRISNVELEKYINNSNDTGSNGRITEAALNEYLKTKE